jgi:hypothetical protein
MSYQADIFAAIQGNSALTTRIGDRFSWDAADGDQATPPYLVAQTISGGGETDHAGDREWSFPLIQFTAWARSKADAIEIIATLRSELEGHDLPGESIVSLAYANEQSTRDTESRLYGEIIDFRASCLTN